MRAAWLTPEGQSTEEDGAGYVAGTSGKRYPACSFPKFSLRFTPVVTSATHSQH